MYFFIRFTGIVKIVLGILFMLSGVAAVIYGFVQNATLISLVNTYWLAGTNTRLIDARFYASLFGLALFLLGMSLSAWGQLLLAFADMANHTRETAILLRAAVRRPEPPGSSTN